MRIEIDIDSLTLVPEDNLEKDGIVHLLSCLGLSSANDSDFGEDIQERVYIKQERVYIKIEDIVKIFGRK